MSHARGIVQNPLCVTPSAGPLPISTSSSPDRRMITATFLAVSSNFGKVNQRSVSQIVRTPCKTCSELLSCCNIAKSLDTGDAVSEDFARARAAAPAFCANRPDERVTIAPAAVSIDALNHLRRVNMTNFCSTNGCTLVSKQLESKQTRFHQVGATPIRGSVRRALCNSFVTGERSSSRYASPCFPSRCMVKALTAVSQARSETPAEPSSLARQLR